MFFDRVALIELLAAETTVSVVRGPGHLDALLQRAKPARSCRINKVRAALPWTADLPELGRDHEQQRVPIGGRPAVTSAAVPPATPRFVLLLGRIVASAVIGQPRRVLSPLHFEVLSVVSSAAERSQHLSRAVESRSGCSSRALSSPRDGLATVSREREISMGMMMKLAAHKSAPRRSALLKSARLAHTRKSVA
jgi:hypothetical protein